MSSFWPHYKHMADRLARLCMAFTGSTHVAPVAVLYPNRTGWTRAGLAGEDGPEGGRVSAGRWRTRWHRLSEELVRAQLDFDYISEDILQDAELSGGHIVARGKGRKHLEEFQGAGAARDDGAGPRLGAGHRGIREQRRTGWYVVGEKPSAYSETGTNAEIPRWLEGLAESRNREG